MHGCVCDYVTHLDFCSFYRTRDNGQGTKDKGQETKDKGQGMDKI